MEKKARGMKEKKNKSSPTLPFQAIAVSEPGLCGFREQVMAGVKVEGLGRYLRCLGVDVKILENDDDHRKAAEKFLLSFLILFHQRLLACFRSQHVGFTRQANVNYQSLVAQSKMMEGVINTAMKQHLLSSNLPSDTQFGFHKGYSAPDLDTDLSQTRTKELNSRYPDSAMTWSYTAILWHYLASNDIVAAMSACWADFGNAAVAEPTRSQTGLKPDAGPITPKQSVPLSGLHCSCCCCLLGSPFQRRNLSLLTTQEGQKLRSSLMVQRSTSFMVPQKLQQSMLNCSKTWTVFSFELKSDAINILEVTFVRKLNWTSHRSAVTARTDMGPRTAHTIPNMELGSYVEVVRVLFANWHNKSTEHAISLALHSSLEHLDIKATY
eukprot:g45955.t1